LNPRRDSVEKPATTMRYFNVRMPTKASSRLSDYNEKAHHHDV
jgi:hypothetical protein